MKKREKVLATTLTLWYHHRYRNDKQSCKKNKRSFCRFVSSCRLDLIPTTVTRFYLSILATFRSLLSSPPSPPTSFSLIHYSCFRIYRLALKPLNIRVVTVLQDSNLNNFLKIKVFEHRLRQSISQGYLLLYYPHQGRDGGRCCC